MLMRRSAFQDLGGLSIFEGKEMKHMNRTQRKGEREDARDWEECLKGKILKEITADLSWEEETLLQLTKDTV